jgi:hypothetical protein
VRDYLKPQFGSSGLSSLMSIYSQGLGCERGPQTILGNTLSELEKMWRREVLGEDVFLAALEGMLPWLALLGIVLIVPLAMTFRSLKTKRIATKEMATRQVE